MERKLFIITLILFLCISFGCDENNAPIEVLFPNGELLPTLQTEIPDEVFAAMKIQADEMSKTVNRYLTPCEENCIIISGAEERREIRELYIEHGLDKVDFHALQKEYYKRYIDAGGIAIVGPDDVEDEYFYYARDTILAMTSKHPGLRDRLLSKHGRFYMVLVRDNRFSLADMPEHQLSPKVLNDDPWDDSLPASCRMSLGDTAAESVPGFCWAGVRRSGAFIRHPYPMWTFAHEFAHAIDLEIRLQVMPDLEERVKEFARQ